jgi:hypothetical protein
MSRTGGWKYLRNRERLRRREDTCWVCGGYISPDLEWPDPMSWSADYVIAIRDGGSNNGELRAAHLCHNQARSRKTKPVVAHGRQW